MQCICHSILNVSYLMQTACNDQSNFSKSGISISILLAGQVEDEQPVICQTDPVLASSPPLIASPIYPALAPLVSPCGQLIFGQPSPGSAFKWMQKPFLHVAPAAIARDTPTQTYEGRDGSSPLVPMDFGTPCLEGLNAPERPLMDRSGGVSDDGMRHCQQYGLGYSPNFSFDLPRPMPAGTAHSSSHESLQLLNVIEVSPLIASSVIR